MAVTKQVTFWIFPFNYDCGILTNFCCAFCGSTINFCRSDVICFQLLERDVQICTFFVSFGKPGGYVGLRRRTAPCSSVAPGLVAAAASGASSFQKPNPLRWASVLGNGNGPGTRDGGLRHAALRLPVLSPGPRGVKMYRGLRFREDPCTILRRMKSVSFARCACNRTRWCKPARCRTGRQGSPKWQRCRR